jgi:NAD+ synthase (glutamine-hydrolysing)
MKIALAQLNPTVGDIEGNLRLVHNWTKKIAPLNPDLVIFPELFITGYPPRDLLKRNWFIERAEKALAEVAKISEKISGAILIGDIARSNRKTGRGLYNCAFAFYQGREIFRQAKSVPSGNDGFDELRFFDPAPVVRLWKFKGERIGVSIGDEAWTRAGPFDPVKEQAQQGASLFINIAASPFWLGKPQLRLKLIKSHCQRYRRPFVFVNQIGAQDELIFDGQSFIVDRNAELALVLPGFKQKVGLFETENLPARTQNSKLNIQNSDIGQVYQALILGIKDYFRKCGLRKAVVGLSGGIDSAVTAALAVAALGKDAVLGVTMPSEFSSSGSVEDSKALAQNLGIEFRIITITPIYHSYLLTLSDTFAGKPTDVTEENIQARIRGNILMAIANKFGYLVLSTGNKSELSVGYCTLYGDMIGGLAVLGDVPKLMVYELARYINRTTEVIPQAIIEKAPSAELKPGQKDQDTLPPYEVLDQILALYIENGLSLEEIVRHGFKKKVVNWVVQQVARMEFKRRQAPLVLRVTSVSTFRFPVSSRARL